MLLLRKPANSLEKTLLSVTGRVSNVGQSVLMAMVLLVVVDVILRRFFNSPLPWSMEVVEMMLVCVAFFAVAYTGARRRHVSISALTARFPPKAQAIINTVMCFFGVVIFSLMGWGTVVSARRAWDVNEVTGLLPLPIYPFVFVVAFGSFLLALVLLAELLNSIINAVSK